MMNLIVLESNDSFSEYIEKRKFKVEKKKNKTILQNGVTYITGNTLTEEDITNLINELDNALLPGTFIQNKDSTWSWGSVSAKNIFILIDMVKRKVENDIKKELKKGDGFILLNYFNNDYSSTVNRELLVNILFSNAEDYDGYEEVITDINSGNLKITHIYYHHGEDIDGLRHLLIFEVKDKSIDNRIINKVVYL